MVDAQAAATVGAIFPLSSARHHGQPAPIAREMQHRVTSRPEPSLANRRARNQLNDTGLFAPFRTGRQSELVSGANLEFHRMCGGPPCISGGGQSTRKRSER